MDILKHGESAYPADAWVEAQYMSDGGVGVSWRRHLRSQHVSISRFLTSHFDEHKSLYTQVISRLVVLLASAWDEIFSSPV